MKLSEAIRLGAMLKPQGRENLLRAGSSCALGAALDAISELKDDSEREYAVARAAWPLLQVAASHSEHFDGARTTVLKIIWTLNDSAKWTREQIADWVETIEAAQPTTEAAPIAVEVAQ